MMMKCNKTFAYQQNSSQFYHRYLNFFRPVNHPSLFTEADPLETQTALTYSGDEVVLQVEDPQLPTPPVNVLNPFNILLMERNFLQGEDLTLIVLSTPTDYILCNWTDTQAYKKGQDSEGGAFLTCGLWSLLNVTQCQM